MRLTRAVRPCFDYLAIPISPKFRARKRSPISWPLRSTSRWRFHGRRLDVGAGVGVGEADAGSYDTQRGGGRRWGAAVAASPAFAVSELDVSRQSGRAPKLAGAYVRRIREPSRRTLARPDTDQP